MLNLINAASLGFASTPTALVDGVYAGAFPAPDSGGALEFPFFLVFGENYGTLYMYGDKSGWAMDSPTSPEMFGCALFADSFEFASWTGMGTATTTNAPFCATFTAAMAGQNINRAYLWSLRTEATGGAFFNGVEGAVDLSGGYGTTSATWTDGQNIGGYVSISDMAVVDEADDGPTESVAPIFTFSGGKVCYESPPLWNGAYPDAFATYAASIGVTICLDKIEEWQA